MIQHVFEIVAPLFLIVTVGYFYGARVRPEMASANRLIMDVFMPALIFHVMIQKDFSLGQYVPLIIGGALVMLGSGVIAFLLARLCGFAWRSFVPPAMFSNWANLGLPLYVLTLGEAALGGGVMLVVAGNILCFTIGTYIYSGKLTGLQVLRTPIIVAVALGVLIGSLDLTVPIFIDVPLEMLGQVAIPLMLFSLGVRLTRVSFNDSTLGIIMGIFCPLVGVALALLLVQFLPLSPLHQQTLIIFGALPPAVINFMLAEQYNNDPEKVASMVIIGNIMSLIFIPLVLFFMLS